MGEKPNPNANAKPVSTIGSSVIPIINKLQDIIAPVGFESFNISLPQVAVVGSQSSGKSSVLEALVGRDFLPRGCDICTRRPLVLMLEHCSVSPDDDGAEWGEFRHLPARRFYDFSKIRREIQAETERVAGFNKGVSDKQIRLKISSPNVLNMTLIDLPGITKVPVGDQPSDIEARIRKMIMAHITQENCIILAVTPANSDLANSDALQMAREADPKGSRTIGVITKLDIMDRGTDACNFLLGRVVPLRLGYIGVVNRSQEDINYNRSIQDALVREERFFHDHPVYNGLSDKCGIPQLAKKLNQILEQHIRMVLPNLKAELNARMVVVLKELRAYGEDMESKAEQGQGVILLSILRRYCEAFTAMVDGKSQEILTTELSGGARIHYIFQSIFLKGLEEVDPCEDLTDDDIQIAIQNANGPRSSLFVPEVPFEVLVRRQLARLLDPSLQCLRFVYDEMIKISHSVQATELQRYPYLRRRLDEVIGKFLHDGVKPAERMITNIIEIEMDYINSSHPRFIGGEKAVELATQQLKSSQEIRSQSNNDKTSTAGNTAGANSSRSWSIFGSKASSMENSSSRSVGRTFHDTEHSSDKSRSSSTIKLREPPSVLRPSEVTDHEAMKIIATKLLLRSYYDIVKESIQDLVPKVIMHYLVNHAKRELHNTLIQKLYRMWKHGRDLLSWDNIVMLA
ncbi:dynamin-related protein 3A isoform X2 [Manihot esculenta]|uniref:Uncharacterized protein n=2 Tax=Manihot esculenta TaxID=3983 RepID=A0ACB7HVG6_MANES|nr:dynamin-related protein 3A isoform X2 [Manihot esculenta]KAG8656792.1 hypothetical protein MANES_03G006900v8 [Manihot esculenta]OAY53575.1 hypothetical protein MANES_03G006900v8 [Manihot esculenta]